MILYLVGPGPAALSAPAICREFSDAGHRVEVILPPGAESYVGRAAFVGHATVTDAPSGPAQALLYAPADAGVLARLARGFGGDPAYESSASGVRPAVVVPDLDRATAQHPAVQENLELLQADGWRVLGGEFSVEEMVSAVLGGMEGPLSGVRMLVTAGGTREPIDSVRFVGNRSSGKMGLALAREGLRMGAEVSVVAANVDAVEPGVEWTAVETVDGLRKEVMEWASEADVLVMAAAVSDFTPASPVQNKLRRGESLSLDLSPTEDVLKSVRDKNPGLFMVGFAATHGDPVPDAREKLRTKNVDVVVGNDISRAETGFEADENEVYVVGHDRERYVPRASKREVARHILGFMLAEMNGERRK